VGLLLGIPSLLVCVSLTALKLDLYLAKPGPSAQSGSEVNLGRDGIVGIIVAAGTVIGKGFEFFGNALGWISGIFGIVAAAFAVVGACLFLTGRGLVLHATWARIAAGLAAMGFLLVSFLAMTSLRRGGAFALIPIGVSVYMLWVLIHDFTRRRFRLKKVDHVMNRKRPRVKRKLPRARAPLAKFRSDEAAAEYFQTHSVTDVWNHLTESKAAKLSKPLAKAIRERHAAAKAPISIRLGTDQIAAARRIASAKSVGYQTQLRMWIAEGIRREARQT